ncbi:MAG: hypothetical protein K2X71_03285 [Methylobacterium sp.]|uniref:hypothetical protein n=1 Tax=Methylobacterium sp. TaxID=409 RepID=UPI00258B7B9C|nr:hypothetical protein [Methylobacterium sp.]MBY0295053.1 hypothetical protein [Methylobacterium sp.]
MVEAAVPMDVAVPPPAVMAAGSAGMGFADRDPAAAMAPRASVPLRPAVNAASARLAIIIILVVVTLCLLG